ncbi:MAG: hypothetical protein KDN18_16605 [Verrucomicrobiae bacterium]|nr:hypothetical protein [Verrucomicrobiae bacterium]
MRLCNLIAALLFLLLSGWTLTADLAHQGHLLLQSSFSCLVLGIFLTLWMFASIPLAAFPKRILIPAVFLVTVRLSFGWPLLYGMDLRTACLIADAGLVAVAFAHLLIALKGVLLANRPWIRWQHSVAMVATAVLSSVLSLPAGFFGLAEVIGQTSKGYVRLTPTGIDLTERIFEKDGRRVHLIGMAHIADGGFYESLNRSLAGPLEGRRLVLLEGVSDRERILPQSFASGETYRALAEKLGLAEQSLGFAVPSDGSYREDSRKSWMERGVEFRLADIDISELDASHRDHLVSLLKGMEKLDLASIFMMPEGITSAEIEDLLVTGLVGRRNDRLMEVYEQEGGAYAEVFIPWGAAHLPDLERRFISNGYRLVEENRRRGIDFWKGLRKSGPSGKVGDS